MDLNLTQEQAAIEAAHRNADAVLMLGLANGCWVGAPDRKAWDVLNNLTHDNAMNCAKRLRDAGVRATEEQLFDHLAHSWAERFALYFPAEEARIKLLSAPTYMGAR